MLRRIPATLLVYLVILLPTLFVAASWAATPDESMEILLKPNPASSSPMPGVNEATPRHAKRTKRAIAYPPGPPMAYAPGPPVAYAPGPPVLYGPSPAAAFPLPPISKVKTEACAVFPVMPDCILPAPAMGQWDMSVGVIFARLRGKVQCNSNNLGFGFGSGLCSILAFTGGWWNQDIDFTGALGLPVHQTVTEFTARYQFRPNWAFRYSVLGFEANSSGMGDNWWAFGWGLNIKWTHYYHRLGIVYDAIRNCKAKVSVFADWVHTDDTLNIGCNACGFLGNRKWGRNGDSMIAGLELQRCIRTFANGGTFSTDCKAGAIFLDDVEGWDAEAGARYSIPLNCGRWGYLKGGYRLVDMKKGQQDISFNQALEGGFMEFGFIF